MYRMMLEYSIELQYEGQHNYISVYVTYDARIQYRTIIQRSTQLYRHVCTV